MSAEGGSFGPRLLTSAGKNGYFFTDISLAFDHASHRLIGQQATNNVVGMASGGRQRTSRLWSTVMRQRWRRSRTGSSAA
jgi:hypothetical protein